jgi:hypothetical protein
LVSGALLVAGCQGSSPSSLPTSERPALLLSPAGSSGELGYFDGKVYRWQFPSGVSNNQNELLLDCFRAGPDLSGHPSGALGRLYAVFLPGANQHSCPDGTVVHDHILSAVPGSPGYETRWELWEAVPGPEIGSATLPITSEAALLHAAQLGQVLLQDDQIVLLAVVTGPAVP